MSESRTTYSVTYKSTKAVARAIQKELDRLEQTKADQYIGPEPSLVRALIAEHDWTQTGVAELLRVNVSTVRRWTTDSGRGQYVEMPYAAWCLLLHASGVESLDRLAA